MVSLVDYNQYCFIKIVIIIFQAILGFLNLMVLIIVFTGSILINIFTIILIMESIVECDHHHMFSCDLHQNNFRNLGIVGVYPDSSTLILASLVGIILMMTVMMI